MEMHKRSQNDARRYEHSNEGLTFLATVGFGLLFLLFMAGCSSLSQQAPPASAPTSPVAPPTIAACTTKECFISLAKDCKEIKLTLTEDAGILTYSSSQDCVFTKTLVSLSINEAQEMKNLLEGKSLTCRYEKGKFDPRWVTSLIFGTEYCEGELKDSLVELIAFT